MKSSKRKKEREDLRLQAIAKIMITIDRLGGEIAFDEAYLFGSVTKPFRFLESADIDIGFVGLDGRQKDQFPNISHEPQDGNRQLTGGPAAGRRPSNQENVKETGLSTT